MKKVLLIIGVCILTAVLLFLGSAYFLAQRADYGWDPAIATPSFIDSHPRVLIDEGHHNASTAGFTGRYWPFGRLLRADGYAVERREETFTLALLDGVQVLVIANASGAHKPQVFGMNIPIPTDKKRSDPAFTASEIDVIRSWVEQGGSLLLIADHAPFGEAAAALGAAFGVTMHKGFVEVPQESSDPLLFSTDNGRLGDHPIVRGDRASTAVRRVMTYTGQSLDAPAGATVLLRLPGTAVEGVPEGDSLVERPAGQAQGVAFDFGKGRVVVLGEGAMVTAQVNRREPFGMNTPDNDNRLFVLNVMQWLARRL
ncbi:MAG: DUF4350 domain-containing protein [Acidobacteria bacterium]|nr:DUF4350 domain-containing protein [Acidobacteriota bacterium]MCL5287670.1 DUF4350 domain-containing protein [Acidobacteriota bacterium]